MSFISKSQQLFVATTVTKRLNEILGSVERESRYSLFIGKCTCQGLANAMYFFLAIAVVAFEVACYLAVYYLDLGSEYSNVV